MHTSDAREQMIEQQVRAWDVLDARVLEVMRRVPRELFVPSAQRYRAYADVEVPLARGQHMLRPSVAGRLLQALLPQAGEAVLQIGAGSGFVTARLEHREPVRDGDRTAGARRAAGGVHFLTEHKQPQFE